MITYYRADERVIHGQTLNVITKQIPCDAIIVVDDSVANDQNFCALLKGMTQIKVLIFTEEIAIKKLPEAEESKKNYFVIFKRVRTLAHLIKKGYVVKPPTLMVGPQTEWSEKKTTFFFTMELTDEDIESLDLISSKGVKVYMQSLLNQVPILWEDVKQGKKPKSKASLD